MQSKEENQGLLRPVSVKRCCVGQEEECEMRRWAEPFFGKLQDSGEEAKGSFVPKKTGGSEETA